MTAQTGGAAELPGLAEELALIEAEEVAQMGQRTGRHTRISLDGYVVRLELPELKAGLPDALLGNNADEEADRRVQKPGAFVQRRPGICPAAGGFMGWGASNVDDWQSCRDRAYAPAVRSPACACSCRTSLFFFLPVSLLFCGPQAIISSETEVKADVDIFNILSCFKIICCATRRKKSSPASAAMSDDLEQGFPLLRGRHPLPDPGKFILTCCSRITGTLNFASAGQGRRGYRKAVEAVEELYQPTWTGGRGR